VQRGTILIWGYAEGYNFELGMGEQQKVENPWSRLDNEHFDIRCKCISIDFDIVVTGKQKIQSTKYPNVLGLFNIFVTV
jgi:hypothetical protein